MASLRQLDLLQLLNVKVEKLGLRSSSYDHPAIL